MNFADLVLEDRLAKVIEKSRVMVAPNSWRTKVSGFSSILAAVVRREHPTDADYESGFGAASKEAILEVVLDVSEVLVLHAVKDNG